MNIQSLFRSCAALLVGATLAACSGQSEPPTDVDTFVQAKPVWAQGRETEQNLTLSFRAQIESYLVNKAWVRLAASCNYRLRVNGQFVAHGPAVAAHDFYRVDCIDIEPYLVFGENIVAIEVAGYNRYNFYLLNQPSFLQAEVELDGSIVAATGHNFQAYDLKQRHQDAPAFTFQRQYAEQYTLTPQFDHWATLPSWAGADTVPLAVQPPKQLIARHVPYPCYTLHQADTIAPGVWQFDCNYSGFLGIELEVSEPTQLRLGFDELLSGTDANGRPVVNHQRICWGQVEYTLAPGHYCLESYEPYTMKYVDVHLASGAARVQRVWLRDYCGSGAERATFHCSDSATNILFEAARETYRQNAVDVFMDCPSRERAGWLCDSYFTARASASFTGETRVERNFLENFLLPDTFRHIAPGMLPMCYPSDHPDGNFIPNWAMWFVLELEEYHQRSGDQALVQRAKPRVYALIDFFKQYLNADGLLERLPRWVFVEWSPANSFVQDVNYPSNMLYARMLQAAGQLYHDPSLCAQAQQVRQVVCHQSFDGDFFVDNALRLPDGTLQPTRNRTETCQYYAMALGTATPQSHPQLWQRMLTEFGPVRMHTNAWSDVHVSNAFIGNYLRMEVLSMAGRAQQILDENREYYVPQALRTGTLWEWMDGTTSCNHGFASHIGHTLLRDILGLRSIDPCKRHVVLQFAPTTLATCQGSVPVGQETIALDWTQHEGNLSATLNLPPGWTWEYSAPSHTSCQVKVEQ